MTMEGHPHDVEPDVLAPIVERFVRAAERASDESRA
jgi:hypothetical protein